MKKLTARVLVAIFGMVVGSTFVTNVKADGPPYIPHATPVPLNPITQVAWDCEYQLGEDGKGPYNPPNPPSSYPGGQIGLGCWDCCNAGLPPNASTADRLDCALQCSQ